MYRTARTEPYTAKQAGGVQTEQRFHMLRVGPTPASLIIILGSKSKKEMIWHSTGIRVLQDLYKHNTLNPCKREKPYSFAWRGALAVHGSHWHSKSKALCSQCHEVCHSAFVIPPSVNHPNIIWLRAPRNLDNLDRRWGFFAAHLLLGIGTGAGLI